MISIPNRYQKIINKSAEDYYDTYDEIMIDDLVDSIEKAFKDSKIIPLALEYLDGRAVDELNIETWMELIDNGWEIPFSFDAKDEWYNIFDIWYSELPDAGQWAGEQAYGEYESAMEDRYDY